MDRRNYLDDFKRRRRPLKVREKQSSSLCRNKKRLGRNSTRGTVVNRVQDDVGKAAPRDHPHSPAQFQVDGQYI
ncbi:hypothetical protein TNCV_1154321 [Trichonephila clavipes]|nr:hypothetical protein TNCV_1154321 [Trichonephila clavipes]